MGHTIDRLLHPACVSRRNRCAAVCLLALGILAIGAGAIGRGQVPAHQGRARRFLAGRRGGSAAVAAGLDTARQRQAAMQAEPRAAPFTANWEPVGPGQIASLNYGNVTGRVTSIAPDPADATGNTVYIGTTGGGVWRSTNATAAAASVVFTPLTDTLAVFSPGSGGATVPSLSIGAVSVANGVLLAGTGDPNDALDSYYGSGILRVAAASAGDATAWSLLQQSNDGAAGIHSWIGLGFAGFAWSGTAPATVVAAVSDAAEGELVDAGDPVYSTRGLYFSTDAGATWQMATIRDGSQVVQSPQALGMNHGGNAATAVVWNPVRQRFYAAVRYHGYYESADGTVWTRLAAQPGAGLTAAACPPKTNTTGSAGCPIFRGALAVEPASGDMYAFTVDGNNLDQGIWRDVCNANGGACANGTVAFGVQLDSTPLEEGFGSTRIEQGDYDLSLAAVASGTETLLFAGTVDLYRCALTTASAGGGDCAFRNTTNAFNGCAAPAMVAPAQHAIAALAQSPGPLVYLGNDGGVWRSTDGVAETGTPCSASDAGHFQNLNGGLGSLDEVVSFAQDPSSPGTLIVGVGANGTAATSSAGTATAWPQLAAGEGGYTAIDTVTPANWYISTGPGVNISYCANGAKCAAADFAGLPTVGEVQVDEDASVIDAPWILDPAFPANVVIGTCRVWRGPGSNGTVWSGGNAISAEFGGSGQSSCGAGEAFVRSLAAGGAAASATNGANAGSKVLYAGMAGTLDGGGTLGGHLFATTAGDTATATTRWTDLGLNPVTNDTGGFNPGGFDISSVAADPHDPTGATVYATVMGFAQVGSNAAHVYRSVDGGAHWTNISSNLPDAPANAVVVDPNDAGTVYVAMDTGVYATTAVSTCAAGPCWSVLGTGLPNAPVVGLEAGAGLADGAGDAGLLRAATYGRGIWEIPLLTAAPATVAAVGLSPPALSFAAEAVGSTSAAQTIAVANTGSASVVLTGLSTTGDFAETDNCAGMTLAPGASCAAQVKFAATAIGQRLGTLTVVFEKAGTGIAAGRATALLSGTGEAAAALALNPSALNFGGVVAGTTSPAQSVTVANTGGSPATLGAPTMTGDFAIAANGCGGTLAAGTQCSVGVVFMPTGTGTRNGTLSVPASTGTQTASLTGVGESPATDTVSPGALNFGQQQQNTTSAAQTITLTNSGDIALSGITAAISGAGFALTNGCAGTLAGHSACMMTVTFTPGSVGAETGTVTVTDALRAQTVLLSGTGYPPPRESVAPASLSFGPVAVGVSSPVQQLTVTNSGGGTLALGAVTATGDFSQTNSCAGAMLGGGIHCAVNVVFTPTALGTRTGTVTIAGASDAGVTVPLTGVGATLAAIGISPGSLSFGSVQVGRESATLSLTVTNSGGLPGAIGAAAVTGDFQLQSNYCGTALAAGAQCSVGIVFLPAAAGARTGTFTIAGPNGVLTATLTGTGLAPATDTLSPMSLSFAAQETGTASAAQTVLLTNSGDATLTGVQAAISPASFKLANGCGNSLAGHAQCSLSVAFEPTAAGPVSGTLLVQDQSRAQPQSVPLSGTGLAPGQIVLTPGTASFGSVVVGTPSAAQNVTVSNTGGVAATLGAATVTGDFAITANTCGTNLAPQTGCTIALVFTPTAAGTRSGKLAIAESSGSQSATVMAGLTGTGLAPATDTLSPLTLSFGPQVYGTTSAAQNVTLTNSGDATLAPIAAAIVSGSYTVVNNCGGSLAGHMRCTLAVAFAPTAAGPMPGVLTVTDPLRTQSVALSGTGTGPPLAAVSPAALSFGLTGVGAASPAQTVTVSNAGGGTLTIAKIAATGDFAETDDCAAAALVAPATCTAQVVFSPAATGTRTGTLTVTASAGSSAGSGTTQQTATVALNGMGAAPANLVLTPAGLSFGSLLVGASSSAQNITVSNTGGVAATLGAAAVTGDFQIAANTCGTTLAAQTGCTVTLVFSPTAAGTRTGVFSIANTTANPAVIQTAALTGTGLAPATDTLAPLALNFGSQQYGSASAPQTVTLTNSGDAVLTLISASIASANFSLANGCGPTLAGHSSCPLIVEFTPTAGGALTGTLVVSDALRTQSVPLSGTGIAPPLAGLTPPMLSFAATGVGQLSPPQTLTVTNTGGGTLILSGVAVTSGFSDTETCTRVGLAAGAACTVQVVFQPVAAGPNTGVLTLTGNMPGGQATAPLSGTAVAPAMLVLTPVSLNFGTVTLGQSANPPQDIAISNTGGVADTLGAAAITGDFAITANTCGTSLAAQTGCTAAIGFTPTAAGTRSGTFTITDAAGTHTVTLTGVGATPATDSLSPLMLSFAAQQVGTTSAAQTVTLTNAGDNALTLVSAQITSGDFTALSGCGNTLAGHASCTIAVSYAPKTVGAETGVLTVSDQFRTQTVALAGTGTAAPGVSITPASLSFAALGVGQTSSAQALTVSNNGAGLLVLNGVTANGDFTLPAAGNTCGGTLAPAASCTVQVAFAPTAGGARSGSVSFADNAAGSPQRIALTGVGVDFSLASDGPGAATVSSGGSASYALLLTSAAGVPGTASIGCTGAPANALCTVSPTSAPLGGTAAVITVTVETGVTAAAEFRLDRQRVWWALLPVMFWAGAFRVRRWRGLLGMALLCCLVFAAGCGSSRTIPSGGGGGGGGGVVTPPGTYPITVTATSAGLSRTVELSLTVQ